MNNIRTLEGEKFVDYFIRYKKIMNAENINIVVDLAKKHSLDKKDKNIRDLIIKIENHKNRYSLTNSSEELIALIIEHDFVASFFAKEAGKQNASEKAQLNYLKNKNINLEDLPNSIIKGGYKMEGVAKTLDYRSKKYPNRYFIGKVCMGNGGAQDSVFNEVRDAVKNVILKPNEELYALIDGTRFHADALIELKQYETNKIKITNCDDYGKEWTNTAK